MSSVPSSILKGISDQFRYVQAYETAKANGQNFDFRTGQAVAQPDAASPSGVDAFSALSFQALAAQAGNMNANAHTGEAFRRAFQYYQQYFTPTAFLAYNPNFGAVWLSPPPPVTDT
ncbi:MAG: hypothetical protein IPK79_10955 [Vampirovibrionales bacterium]|nr:hypothetical protein [Vampirovibrionales bacterium]